MNKSCCVRNTVFASSAFWLRPKEQTFCGFLQQILSRVWGWEGRDAASGAASSAQCCWQGSFLQSCRPSDQHRALSGCSWVFRGSLCGFCSLCCCSCQIPADQHRSTKNENWTRAAARTTHRAEGNKVRDGQEEQQLLPFPPGDQRLLLLPAQRPEGLRGAGSKG